MPYMATTKYDGKTYPLFSFIDERGVFGILRWRNKKWKLADQELDLYHEDAEKVHISWKDWKKLERRANARCWMLLHMYDGCSLKHDEVISNICHIVQSMMTSPEFELQVDEYGEAVPVTPEIELDNVEIPSEEMIDALTNADPYDELAYHIMAKCDI